MRVHLVCFIIAGAGILSCAADDVTNLATPAQGTNAGAQIWNWHAQNTDIVQGTPGFPAKYSGPNSLASDGQTRETVAVDFFGGVRLWPGAEAHIDALIWQGFGLSGTEGIEAFPSGEAYRLGTKVPNIALARLFIRQTINLGGDTQIIDDGPLQLAGKQDANRVVLTLGEISALDVFDNNTYAHDPTTQFFNWAFVGNEAWDYPANSLGYMTGMTAELYWRRWAFRYGLFQMPDTSNGMATDEQFLEAWGMVAELERDWSVQSHPGALRLLAYVNQARMGSYDQAINAPGADIVLTRAYRDKFGFCLNWEQEIFPNVGLFSRMGWSDGRTESWCYSDVDASLSGGVSVNGKWWNRPNDTCGLAAVISSISGAHQAFLAAGGTGILAGDGALTYSPEKALETYYDFQIWKDLHAALDYQFVVDPAFNQARGPVSVFGARVHWQF